MSQYRVGDYVRALIDQVTGKVVGWRTPADTDQLIDSLAEPGKRTVAVDAITAVDTTGLVTGDVVFAKGRDTAGDGGGGSFLYYATSMGTDNNVTIFGGGKLLRVFSGPIYAAWGGAKFDGVTDDTAALNRCLDASGLLGGVKVICPKGTAIVSNSNPGAASWDNQRALYMRYDNIALEGQGRSTILKVADGADCHAIQIGQRATSTLIVTGCSVRHLTVDGNRANQTPPSDTVDHWHAVSVNSGCHNTVLQFLYLHDLQYYGIGMQRDDWKNCHISDIEIENCGADGIDWKDDTDTATGNTLQRVTVKNWGLESSLVPFGGPQAGVDLRSGVAAEDIVVILDDGETHARVGIRTQDGLSGGTPVQPSQIGRHRCIADNAAIADRVGVRAISRWGAVVNGRATGWSDGYNLTDPDKRFSNLEAISNAAGFRLWQNSGASREADTCTLTGLVARSNTNGVIFDSVDECTMLGCDIRSNTGNGLDIRTGSSNIRMLGGSLSGNGTNLIDNGTGTIIQNVSGFRTASAEAASISIATTGFKSASITHNLAVTPNISDVVLSVERVTNVADFALGHLFVTAVSSTVISIATNVTTASATGGATINVRAHVRAKAIA